MAHSAFVLDMDPHDRLLAAIVKQAIADYQYGGAGRPGSTSLLPTSAEYGAAREYLAQLGLLDDAGELVADVSLVWPAML